MADTDTPRVSTMVFPREVEPLLSRLASGTIALEYGQDATLFFTSAALDRLTDAISTFRASEAQAEAA